MNLLIEISQQCNPRITYSTIQVTKNAEASPHYDAKSSGKSYLYCLGSYTGGGLWIQSPSGTDVQRITKQIRGKAKSVKLGMELPGDYYVAHETMLPFDPQDVHTTEPFKGTRYAITYYALTRWQELEPTAQEILNDVGFRLPSTLSLAPRWGVSTARLMRRGWVRSTRAKRFLPRLSAGSCPDHS